MKKKIVFKDTDDYFLKMNKEVGMIKDNVGKSLYYNVEKEFGEGYIERIILRNGIEISVVEMKLNCEFELEYKMEKTNFEIVYCVEGNVSFGEVSKEEVNFLNACEIGYWTNENVEGWMRYPMKKKLHCIAIHFEETFIESFLKVPEIELDIETFRNIIKGNYKGWNMKSVKIPEFEVAYMQILNCKHQGISRILYLESKAIEIISLFMEHEILSKKRDTPKIFIKAEERKKLAQVKDILIENMTEPLTIDELSKIIGMNTYKLKVGFKELYGMTIFSFLRDAKMEKARYLLMSKDRSVMEIAYDVGYANPSKFSAAFKRKYGVSPRDLRLRA